MVLIQVVGLSSPYHYKEENMMKKVLLAESSRNISIMIEKYLELNGYNIELAVDGIETMAKTFEVIPDIIVMDLTLPKLNGLLVSEALRSNEKFSKVPIIIMSSEEKEEEIIASLASIEIDYILKPFTLMELLDRIQKHVIEKGERN